MEYKLIGNMLINGKLDRDNELEIEVNEYDFWINKEEAKELINHISTVFGIKID